MFVALFYPLRKTKHLNIQYSIIPIINQEVENMPKISKKAQGMPINIIIIAAISLLVLVILVIIFTGRTGMFAKETGNCVNVGGTCTTGECSELSELSKESSAKCYYTTSDVLPEGKKVGDVNTGAKCCISVS
jgi:hypothetical protein